MARKVAVVLCGCGYLDGAEIHESVLALYFLERAGLGYQCFAPNKQQAHVVDHLTGEPTGETRHVLTESARIARGSIKPLNEATMNDFDALVIPGGYGAAKNLSNFAVKGADCSVDDEVARVILETHDSGKPIVALCIAPAIVAAALQPKGVAPTVTIGNDPDTATAIRQMGAKHEACSVDLAVVDEPNKIITTPAYMLGPNPSKVGAGIEQAINQLAKWIA